MLKRVGLALQAMLPLAALVMVTFVGGPTPIHGESISEPIGALTRTLSTVNGSTTDPGSRVNIANAATANFVPTLTWSSLAPMPTPRLGPGVAAVNGKVYALGGYTNEVGSHSDVEEYDPTTNSWRARARMLGGRSHFAAAALDGKIYVIGGYNHPNVLATVEEYDPVADTWRTLASMAYQRYQPALVAVNGKLYAIGGAVFLPEESDVGPIEEYDPVTDSWRVRASIPTPRFRLAAAAANGKILVAGGGRLGVDYLSVMEEYDSAVDSWRRLADMPTARYELGMATGANGRVYAVGGQACCYAWLSTVEEYDPITDIWAPTTNMPSARTTPGVTLGSDGKIYAIGGRPGIGGPDTASNANEAGTITSVTPLTITTLSPLPSGTVGVPYSTTFTATGGTEPYSWSFASGSTPPPGLGLDPVTGVLSGTPTTAGTFGFTVQVSDSSSLTVTKQYSFTPPPPPGNEGDPYQTPVVLPAPGGGGGTATCTSGYSVISGTLPPGVTLDPVTGVISGTPSDGGTYTFTVACTVAGGQTASKEFTITINNAAPSNVTLTVSPSTIDENGSTTVSGSFTDPGTLDTHTVVINWGPGEGSTTLRLPAGVLTFSAGHQYLDDNPTATTYDSYTINATVTDDDGDTVDGSATITVNNVEPIITGNIVPVGPQPLGMLNISAPFTDVGTQDVHNCTIDWDDGVGPVAAVVSEDPGDATCGDSHAYTTAGVYAVTVKVTDDDTGVASLTATDLIVVYDPSAGFVTGGGWYNSKAGSDRLNLTAVGKANFGFVAKYKKGASVPDGETEFQFQAGALNFHSTAYEWLVVTGGCTAQYKGTGVVNGVAGYTFLLTLRDGQLCASPTTDGFRIKITGPGGLRYDTRFGDSDDIGPQSGNVQDINGGSIVIHRN